MGFSFFFTSRAAARFLDGIGRPGVSTAALLLTAASGGGLVAYADSAAESAPEPSQDAPKKKVLVLGTGWAGTSFLKNLDCSRYEVKVISPRNYFAFTPLLPSVTCGAVEPRSIIEPIRRMFEKIIKKCNFFMWLDEYIESLRLNGTMKEARTNFGEEQAAAQLMVSNFGEEGDASRADLSILTVELKKMNGNLNRIIELKKEEVLHVYILAAFCAFMIFIGLIFVMMNYGC